jgi:predicted nucleic acid binding AN1-type Zn finger protein
MNAMIAYCGLACGTCPIHLATLEQDKLKQQSMRAEIAKIFTEQYGMSIQVQDIADCDGCRTGGRLFSGCARCEIRKCAIEHTLGSCAFCNEYACEKLQKHFETDQDARTRLEELRATT